MLIACLFEFCGSGLFLGRVEVEAALGGFTNSISGLLWLQQTAWDFVCKAAEHSERSEASEASCKYYVNQTEHASADNADADNSCADRLDTMHLVDMRLVKLFWNHGGPELTQCPSIQEPCFHEYLKFGDFVEQVLQSPSTSSTSSTSSEIVFGVDFYVGHAAILGDVLRGWRSIQQPRDRSLIFLSKQVVLACVKQSGHLLAFAPNSMQNDLEVVLAAVESTGDAIAHASVELQQNAQVLVTSAKTISMGVVNDCTYGGAKTFCKWQCKDVVLALVQRDGMLLQYACKELQNCPCVVLAAAEQNPHAFKYASKLLQDSAPFIRELIRRNPLNLAWATTKMRNNPKLVAAAVTKSPTALQFASKTLCANKDIVMISVVRDGRALEFASSSMRNDADVVAAAIHQNPDAFKFASDELKANLNMALYVFKQPSTSADLLKYMSSSLRNNKQVVLAAVSVHGYALAFAGAEMRCDHEVVMTAIKQDGRALSRASPAYRSNKVACLAAVKTFPEAVTWIDEKLFRNQAFVLSMVNRNADVLLFAHSLKRMCATIQHSIAHAAVTLDGCALGFDYLHEQKFHKHKQIVMAAVKNNGMALKHAFHVLQDDLDVVMAAVTQNGLALQFAGVNACSNLRIVLKAVNNTLHALQYALTPGGENMLYTNDFVMRCCADAIVNQSGSRTLALRAAANAFKRDARFSLIIEGRLGSGLHWKLWMRVAFNTFYESSPRFES